MKEEKNRLQMLKSDLNRLSAYHNYDLPEGFGLRMIILYNAIISKSFRSIYFYRLANTKFFKKNEIFRTLLLVISKLFLCLDIPFTADIGEGLLMSHPFGIVLHPKCIIGRNATILQGVTIGGNIGKTKNGRTSPMIGDNVLISAGAKILGPISIGDNSIIGANAVVITDIPKDSVAVGIPAKRIKKVEKNFIELEKIFKDKF
ncbi:MAG: DapH/DapD/GlmU-related protein [Methanobacteriaceae archaeon]|nr:DapH/DapD/GlmU-related protein [Methanobacteriaceae archaeon]